MTQLDLFTQPCPERRAAADISGYGYVCCVRVLGHTGSHRFGMIRHDERVALELLTQPFPLDRRVETVNVTNGAV